MRRLPFKSRPTLHDQTASATDIAGAQRNSFRRDVQRIARTLRGEKIQTCPSCMDSRQVMRNGVTGKANSSSTRRD